MEIVPRRSVRAVVLTPDRAILLMRTTPRTGNAFWFTPGGGLEPGESHEQALRRELREELGIVEFAIGPLLGRHRFVSETAERHQHIYLIEHAHFEPYMSDPVEVHAVDAFRWWHLSELLQTTEVVYPTGLAERILRHVEDGREHVATWVDRE